MMTWISILNTVKCHVRLKGWKGLGPLAFHYVQSFAAAWQKVDDCLTPGGAFILSVEHPIFTAGKDQDWYYDAQEKRRHWPVDNYQAEGLRQF